MVKRVGDGTVFVGDYADLGMVLKADHFTLERDTVGGERGIS
jgi:hypothetical protein